MSFKIMNLSKFQPNTTY